MTDVENEVETPDVESVFGAIDWDEGSDNPFGLDPGTHEVTISKAEVSRSKSSNLGLWVTFTDSNSKSARKWISLPEPTQDHETRSRNTSFLKFFYKNLEIPSENWPVMPEDLIGLDCVIVVTQQKNNPDYTQINKITRSRRATVDLNDGFDY